MLFVVILGCIIKHGVLLFLCLTVINVNRSIIRELKIIKSKNSKNVSIIITLVLSVA